MCFPDLGGVQTGKDAPKTRIFHTRVPLAPNLPDHNHLSGKSWARGQSRNRQANLETGKFVIVLSSQGEIDALTITHPPQSRRVNPMLPVGTFSAGRLLS